MSSRNARPCGRIGGEAGGETSSDSSSPWEQALHIRRVRRQTVREARKGLVGFRSGAVIIPGMTFVSVRMPHYLSRVSRTLFRSSEDRSFLSWGSFMAARKLGLFRIALTCLLFTAL